MLYLQQGIQGQKPCAAGVPQFLNRSSVRE